MKHRTTAVAIVVALFAVVPITGPDRVLASPTRANRPDLARAAAALARFSGAQQRYSGPATLSTTCYTYSHADRAGDTTGPVDLAAVALSYDCAQRRWRFDATFTAPVSSKWLGADLVFDTDGNPTNNCGGSDVTVLVAWISSLGRLAGAIGTLDKNCNAHFTASVSPDRTGGPRTLAFAFGDSYMRQDFGWGVATTGLQTPTKISDFDLSPSRGDWPAVSTRSTAFTAAKAPSLAGSYRTPIPTADFNGDGYDDMLLYAPGAAGDQLLFGGITRFTSRPITINSVYTQIVGGDFDRDGFGDLAFYTAGSGPDFFWFGSQAGTFTRVDATINGTYQLVTGDFNCDGTTDLVLAKARGGAAPVWYVQSDRTIVGGTVTLGAGNVNAGDFNGDGCTDLLTWQAGAGADSMRLGSVFGFASAIRESINGAYTIARTGDFNADGNTDVLFFTPDTAADGMLVGKTTGTYLTGGSQAIINERYDDIVTGDFNRDGADDALMYGRGAFPERLFRGLLPGPVAMPGAVGPMVVDESMGRVYVASGPNLVVFDRGSHVAQTLTGFSGSVKAIAFDANTLYVSSSGSTILPFDRTSLTPLTPIDVSSAPYLVPFVAAGGRLWWNPLSGGLEAYDPGGPSLTNYPVGTGYGSRIEGDPTGAARLFQVGSTTQILDVSTATPSVASSSAMLTSAFGPDGSTVLVEGVSGIAELDAATFASTGVSYRVSGSLRTIRTTAAAGGWIIATWQTNGLPPSRFQVGGFRKGSGQRRFTRTVPAVSSVDAVMSPDGRFLYERSDKSLYVLPT